MNLIIDEGNTLTKIAVFDSKGKLHSHTTEPTKKFDVSFLHEINNKFPIKHTIISSVITDSKLMYFCQTNLNNLLVLNSNTPVPFVNKYDTPETLGIDRIALAAASTTQFPQQNVLVIDAGTCITFDLVTAEGEFLGGAIAPGINMRLKAMHEFVPSLPLLSDKDFDIENFVGKNTKSCMLSGVYNNVVQEIEGIHAQYRASYKNLTLVLTGGDHLFLAKNIKSRIFVNSYFLLEGLNAILEYNIKYE